ncbi:TPA: hypothetical protein WID47_002112 [Neisseria meningitidis]
MPLTDSPAERSPLRPLFLVRAAEGAFKSDVEVVTLESASDLVVAVVS